MIKKLSIVLMFAFLFAFALTAKAQTTASNQGVAECMQMATSNKNATFQTSREAFTVAIKAAKERGESTWWPWGKARVEARKIGREARRVANEAFALARENCQANRPAKTEGDDNEGDENADQAGIEAKVVLAALNTSGIFGEAKMETEEGKTEVKISLSGVLGSVSMPAHIHSGTCASTGAVVYPLTSLVNGVSETELNVTLAQLKAMLPLVINVHKSDTESTVYVACGEITL